MTLTVVCGMPGEKHVATKCFPNAQIIQYDHSITFNLNTVVANTCTHILSFGLCGGVAPQIGVTEVAIANSLVDETGVTYPLDIEFLKSFMNIVRSEVKIAPWYSSQQMDVATTVVDRAALYKKTGVWAVDDESFYCALVAQTRKISFNIIRAVSDDWKMNLPPAATGNIMNENGSTNYGYLIKSIFKAPWQIKSLIELGVWEFKCYENLEDIFINPSMFFDGL